MELHEWIKEARAAAGMTQERFGELLGVTKGNVSSWENRRHLPSYKQIIAMAGLSGLMPPVDEEIREKTELVVSPRRRSSEILPGYVRLKMLDATPFMGAEGVPVDFPDVLQHVDIWRDYLVVELGVNPDNICLLPVRGDSMSPTIEHGDMVFVDRTVREFDGDGVYVVVWNNGLIVKRLQALARGGIRLKSDNGKYDSTDIAPEETADLTVCARVVGSWKVRRI